MVIFRVPGLERKPRRRIARLRSRRFKPLKSLKAFEGQEKSSRADILVEKIVDDLEAALNNSAGSPLALLLHQWRGAGTTMLSDAALGVLLERLIGLRGWLDLPALLPAF
jgi:hypothetical protein